MVKLHDDYNDNKDATETKTQIPPPGYLYSQSESHIMAAEMRTTTLPRASAST